MTESSLPERWHIYVVDLEPRVGTKPGKQRPCLSIQPSIFAKAGLDSTVLIPLTTQVTQGNAYPLRIKVPTGTCGLKKNSELLIDQIVTWDNQLIQKDLGIIPEGLRLQVLEALRDFLDLDHVDD
jgi:mRNA interferase MazF